MRFYTIIIPCLAITACTGNSLELEARVAARKTLYDPGSAQFLRFTEAAPSLYCLEVLAKNSLGGYAGHQQATIVNMKDGMHVVGVAKESHELCIQRAKMMAGVAL